MPLTSVKKDPVKLTLTVVGDYAVSQQRLWQAFTDPRQLERFWGPPVAPCTFTSHDFRVGGRADYFLALPDGNKWRGAWVFTAIHPVSAFEAKDGDDNVDDENMPAGMKFFFEATATGSRFTGITQFASLEAMEQVAAGMEEGLRAAMPQLDVVLGGGAPPAHAQG